MFAVITLLYPGVSTQALFLANVAHCLCRSTQPATTSRGRPSGLAPTGTSADRSAGDERVPAVVVDMRVA